MSCVISLKDDTGIYMGADSAVVMEMEIQTSISPKLFRNGDYLIGFAGAVRPGQTLCHPYWTPPKDILDMPDAIMAQLEDKGCLRFADHSTGCESEFLIGYKNRIFNLGCDFTLIEPADEYMAIGSGRPYALGALYSIRKSRMSPQKKILKALECAEYYTPTVRGPFHVFKLSEVEES